MARPYRYRFGMKFKDELSHLDRQHLKFFCREVIEENLVHYRNEHGCIYYYDPAVRADFFKNINHNEFVPKKFGTSNLQEILWMFSYGMPIGNYFVGVCKHSELCVNPSHLQATPKKDVRGFPIREFVTERIIPNFRPYERDDGKHLYYINPFTKRPSRLVAKQEKYVEYRGLDIVRLVWKWENGTIATRWHQCHEYYCIRKEHNEVQTWK